MALLPKARSTFARHPTSARPGAVLFDRAVEELKKLGVKAEVVESTVPVNRPDVAGVMTGTPEVNWAKSGSKILPGALCENFTSFGGTLTEDSSQTPLTEFLRFWRGRLQRHRRPSLMPSSKSSPRP